MQNSHDDALVQALFGVPGPGFAGALGGRDAQRPHHGGDVDGEDAVGQLAAGAHARAEAEGDVALALGPRERREQLLRVRVQEPRRVEVGRVLAVEVGAAIDGPDVGDEDGALGDEMALVVYVLQSTFGLVSASLFSTLRS